MQGTTRMLLTVIPYFKEVILMSFKCEHCGNSNTEIQSAGEIQRESSLGFPWSRNIIESSEADSSTEVHRHSQQKVASTPSTSSPAPT